MAEKNEITTMQEERLLLTKRETEVLQLLSNGLNHEQMAASMNISKKTIGNYCDNIRKKFGNKKMVEIVKVAVIEGIII